MTRILGLALASLVLSTPLFAQEPPRVRTPYLPDQGQVPVEELERQAAAFPEVFVLQGPTAGNRVALTFDDGPSPFTPALLDVLKDKGVKATFFVLGSAAAKRTAVLKRAFDEGHTIGNHTWDHPYLTKLKVPTRWFDQVERTQTVLESVLGVRARLFRPPYGFLADEQIVDLGARGMRAVAWSVASDDWYHTARLSGPDAAAAIADQVLTYAHPGAIVLMHDAGGKSRRPTVEAVGPLIDRLRAAGYELVTVDQLLGVPPYE